MRTFLAVGRKDRVDGKLAKRYTVYEIRNGYYIQHSGLITFSDKDSLISFLCDIIGDEAVRYYSKGGITFAEAGYHSAIDIPKDKVLARLDFIEAL